MSEKAFDHDNPWLRQPFDRDSEWPWFSEYLAMGPNRRLLALAKRPGCPFTWAMLESLAHEYAWKERAQAWDTHLDQLRLKTIESEIQEDARQIAKRHSLALRNAFKLSSREIEKLVKVQESSDGIGLISPAEARRYLETAIKLERLLMGEVTERTEIGPDLSNLSLDELRTLKALTQKTEAA